MMMLPLWTAWLLSLALVPWALVLIEYGYLLGLGGRKPAGAPATIGGLIVNVDGQTVVAKISQAVIYGDMAGNGKIARLVSG